MSRSDPQPPPASLPGSLDYLGTHFRNYAIFGSAAALGLDMTAGRYSTRDLIPLGGYDKLPGIGGPAVVQAAGTALALAGWAFCLWNLLRALGDLRRVLRDPAPVGGRWWPGLIATGLGVGIGAVIPYGLAMIGLSFWM